MKRTNDLNIVSISPLISPADLKRELPMTETANETVVQSRRQIRNILTGNDPRLLAIVGPCSIHEMESACEYAEKLKRLHDRYSDKLHIIMRVYFEKPRTTVGWKGLITDPKLDTSNDTELGLKLSRSILLKITGMGLPAATEMLEPIVPQYIAELISWAAIGARTTESQTHREMASGLSMPIGFKNGTDGSLEIAINALESARHPHSFIGIDQDGQTCILQTKGNSVAHIIMRGGKNGPNYYEECIEDAEELIIRRNIPPAIIIDCSHSNSGKKPQKQSRVLRSVIDQYNRGRKGIKGFMLESFLVEGRQDILAEASKMVYGQSITDACLNWEATEELLASTYEKMEVDNG